MANIILNIMYLWQLPSSSQVWERHGPSTASRCEGKDWSRRQQEKTFDGPRHSWFPPCVLAARRGAYEVTLAPDPLPQRLSLWDALNRPLYPAQCTGLGGLGASDGTWTTVNAGLGRALLRQS